MLQKFQHDRYKIATCRWSQVMNKSWQIVLTPLIFNRGRSFKIYVGTSRIIHHRNRIGSKKITKISRKIRIEYQGSYYDFTFLTFYNVMTSFSERSWRSSGCELTFCQGMCEKIFKTIGAQLRPVVANCRDQMMKTNLMTPLTFDLGRTLKLYIARSSVIHHWNRNWP